MFSQRINRLTPNINGKNEKINGWLMKWDFQPLIGSLTVAHAAVNTSRSPVRGAKHWYGEPPLRHRL